ncbi:MAG: FMN-binding protein [Spirochaetales bacterium]
MKARKTLIIIAAVFVAIFAIGSGVKAKLESGLKELAKTDIAEVDLASIADGVYSGSVSAFPVVVELKVRVKDHRIEAIDLIKHTNGQGKPAEALLAKVVQEQKINLDVISGATYSSKAILLAISNALKK